MKEFEWSPQCAGAHGGMATCGTPTIRGGSSGADRPFDDQSPCQRDAAEELSTALLDREVLGYPGRQAFPEEVDVGVSPLHQLGDGIGRPLASHAVAIHDDRL